MSHHMGCRIVIGVRIVMSHRVRTRCLIDMVSSRNGGITSSWDVVMMCHITMGCHIVQALSQEGIMLIGCHIIKYCILKEY